MITFTYDPIHGIAVPDGMVESEYRNIIRLKDNGLPLMSSYSTDNIFGYVRLQIALDKLDCNSVQFCYNGQIFKANEYGAIPDWPNGFCDYMPRLAEQIISTAMAKRKKKIEEAKAKFQEKKNENTTNI